MASSGDPSAPDAPPRTQAADAAADLGVDPRLDDVLRGLDATQREAVTTDAAPLAVIAAAGSGKTTVLTRRIAHRILTGEVLPRHVLALTFTRDAAGELTRRLRRLDLRERVEAGTFHAVALRLLRDRAAAAGTAPPQVATDRIRLAREALTELRLRAQPHAALADLDWARARRIDPSSFERAARASHRRSGLPAAQVADFATAYERIKRRRGVVDFDDLLVAVWRGLHDDPTWAAAVRWRFRHLFVDEAQDLNPLQHGVLEALRDGRPDLCLVGDPRQSIYGWNGAEHDLLARVEQHWPGVTVVRLRRNYRCTPQVVRAGAAALESDGQGDDTVSDHPDGPAVSAAVLTDEVAEAAAVADHVRRLLAVRQGREVAVLARTNDQLGVLEQHLAARGVTTARASGRSPLRASLDEAVRCTSRDALAAWADGAWHSASTSDDPIAADSLRLVADEVDRFLAADEPGTFRAWLDARGTVDESLAERDDDAVALLTFHAAKGREWWAVVVTGVEEGLVPHASASNAAQLAEEARLLHVALTRAAQHLHLTRAERRGRRTTRASRWWDDVLAAGDADRPVAPPPSVVTGTADPMAAWREWRAAVARVGQMPERSVCTDAVLQRLAADPPADTDALAAVLGITPSAARRLRPLPVSPGRSPVA